MHTVLAINHLRNRHNEGFLTNHQREIAETEYTKWLATYESPDKANTEYCKSILRSGHSDDQKGSQFEQDMFIFNNLFKYWPMRGKKGIYVDSGANDATILSNTYFYDICLGWEGICIEPELQYHDKLKSKRTCKLVPTCLSSSEEKVEFSDSGTGGYIETAETKKDKPQGSNKGREITCKSLDTILKENGFPDKHIDLWSLDVEGFEMHILNALNFNEININTILIEDYWVSKRELDSLMTINNFIYYQTLAIDTLYVNRHFQLPVAEVYYPPHFMLHLKRENSNRHQANIKSKLIC